MKILSSIDLKLEYLDCIHFKFLLKSEINLYDNYNNTPLMYLC